MRYRVHKHCRRADCTEWCVSNPLHFVIYSTYAWDPALRWTLARVAREALTSSVRIAEPVDGIGWAEVKARWDAAVPSQPTAEARAEATAEWRREFYGHPIVGVAMPDGTVRTEFYDLRDSLAKINVAPNPLSEWFAELCARAQVVWPESTRRLHSDPAADAEFATPTCGNPAKNDGLTPYYPEYDMSGPGSFMLGDSSDSESPCDTGDSAD